MSGDSVIIKENFVLKIFNDSSRYRREILARRILQKLEFKHSIITEYRHMTDLLLLKRGLIINEYDPVIFLERVAKALYELHSDKNKNIFQDFYQKKIIISSFIEKIKKFKNYCEDNSEIIKNFQEDPGSLCYLHGDASINNFVIDKSTDLVSFIDLSNFKLGFPAYEYYQFISSITWAGFDKGLEDVFMNSYSVNFNENQNNFFKLYWNLKKEFF